jgi:hypothetical protein
MITGTLSAGLQASTIRRYPIRLTLPYGLPSARFRLKSQMEFLTVSPIIIIIGTLGKTCSPIVIAG